MSFDFCIMLHGDRIVVDIDFSNGSIVFEIFNLTDLWKFHRLLDTLSRSEYIDLDFKLSNDTTVGITTDQHEITIDIKVGSLYTYIDAPLTDENRGKLINNLQYFCDRTRCFLDN